MRFPSLVSPSAFQKTYAHLNRWYETSRKLHHKQIGISIYFSCLSAANTADLCVGTITPSCRPLMLGILSPWTVTGVITLSTTPEIFTLGWLRSARLHLSGLLSLFSSTHTVSMYCYLHIVWRKIKLNLSQLIIIYELSSYLLPFSITVLIA